MRNLIRRARQESLLVAETVILGLFAASDATGLLATIFGAEVDAGWVFVAAILIIGLTALVRVGDLRDELERQRATVRLTTQIGTYTANIPDPGPNKQSISVRVVWEIWVNQDVSTDRLALNLYYVYEKRWWQVWKRTRFAQKGIRPKGGDERYRKSIRAIDPQPFRDSATFEYVADRQQSYDPCWELELVLVTGVPSATHRVPVAFDYEEMHNRGRDLPL